MPHRKSPGIPGFFGVQEDKKGPSRRDVFWGNAKDIACGKSSILGSEPAWLPNSESGQKKNKIIFEKGMMKIMALFLFPEKDLGGMQSAKVYRKQDRPWLREFYATDFRLPAGPTRGRDYSERYETEETTERGREE